MAPFSSPHIAVDNPQRVRAVEPDLRRLIE